jgi:hypothetical protein
MRKFAKTVTVDDSNGVSHTFLRGDDVPPWAEGKVTNPGATYDAGGADSDVDPVSGRRRSALDRPVPGTAEGDPAFLSGFSPPAEEDLRRAARLADPARTAAGALDADLDEDEGLVPPYGRYTVPELADEAERRHITVKGRNKPHYEAALESFDEAVGAFIRDLVARELVDPDDLPERVRVLHDAAPAAPETETPGGGTPPEPNAGTPAPGTAGAPPAGTEGATT